MRNKVIICTLLLLLQLLNNNVRAQSCVYDFVLGRPIVVHSISINPGQNIEEVIRRTSDSTEVIINTGIYYLPNGLSLNKKSNIYIKGIGKVNLITKSIANNIISISNSDKIEMSNLKLEYVGSKISGKKNCGRGIQVENCENIYIHNNSITGTYEHGISIYGSDNYITHNIKIEHNIITDAGNIDNKRGWGIWLYKNVQSAFVILNKISDFYGGGIFVDDEHSSIVKKETPCKNITIQDNSIYNNLNLGYTVTGIGIEGSRCIKVFSNDLQMKNIKAEGIKVNKGQANVGVSDISINKNRIMVPARKFNLQDTLLKNIKLSDN